MKLSVKNVIQEQRNTKQRISEEDSMILLIGVAIYFFIAGGIFVDMMTKTRLGIKPLIGAFVFSVLWIPFFTWGTINLFCKTTQRWYTKLGRKIFIGG